MVVVRPRAAWADPQAVALDAEFVGPWGVTFDAAGRVLVADPGAYSVAVFSPEGKLEKRFGLPGSAPGRLNFPTGLASTPDSILVCDTNNGRIAVFDLEGQFVRAIGGLGIATAKLAMPNGVAVSDKWIWVANTRGHVVQRYDRETGVVDQAFGFLGDDETAPVSGATDHKWRLPTAIAVGGGQVFVLDSKHERVVSLDEDGALVWAASPESGGVGLSRPQGLALAEDALYVADTGNRRLLKLDITGRVLDERVLAEEPCCVAAHAGRLAVTFFAARSATVMEAF